MKKIILLFFLSVCFITTATVGYCEDISYARFISPMAGGHLFEGNQDLKHGPTLGFGLGAEFNRQFGWEAVFNYTDSETDPGGDGVDVVTYRLDGFYNLLTDSKLIPYAAAGLGGMNFEADHTSDDDFMLNYGGGVKYFLNDQLAVRCDVRHLITFNKSYNSMLYTVGLIYYFGVEETKTGAMELSPSKTKVHRKKACPGADTDGDGVVDAKDKCPGTPAGVKVDASGCPIDSDGDGVADYMDECPNTPEGVSVDAKGCWEIVGALFETDKWDINPCFYPKLDEVVAFLKKNPELHLEIHGHCDIRGTAAYNQKLSERRANAVLDYFVLKGIDAGRIKTIGFGFTKPIAPNDTPEHMALNRRAEVKQVKLSIRF